MKPWEMYQTTPVADTVQPKPWERYQSVETLKTPEHQESTEPQKQSTMDFANSAAQAVERGLWGSFGINANKLNAGFDATTDYVGRRLAKAFTGNADIIPADSKYNTTGAEREATWRDYYNRALNTEQQRQKEFTEAHPIINTGLEIAGSMKGAGNIIGKALGAEKAGATIAAKLAPKVGAKVANIAGQAVTGALSGSTGGAVYGFGTSNGDIKERLQEALRGAKYGGIIGGAVPIVKAGVQEGVKGGAKLVAKALGATSGAGGESVERAYDAGMRNSQVFKDTMRGKAGVYDVVDDVDKAVRTMEQNASAKWKATLPDNGKNVLLSDTAFKDALKKATDSISGVTAGVDDTAAKAINKVHKLAQNIKASGGLTFNNAEDAKKAIDGIIEPLSRQGEKNAVRLLMPIKNALTDTMEKAIPEYGGARAAYKSDMSLITKIKNALTSKDATTELRKLQGITRQSVAAAQGGKQELGKILDNVSGGRILDAIAGGQVNQVMPRDIVRLGGAGTIALKYNPAALLAASPRAVGEGAYLLGRTASQAQPIINATGNIANKVPAYSLYKALRNVTEDNSLQ